MAGYFFALFDDIASLMDDVAMMTKVATKKTAGVLGDDLALNAQQMMGLRANRELPVVWAVAKGSLLNKAILVPSALLLSAFLPWSVPVLLMLGGAFLCYEGTEKVWHLCMQSAQQSHHHDVARPQQKDVDSYEQNKIKQAVRTDFILSAEIIVIALGEITTQGSGLASQIIALSIIGVLITVMVYGLVAVLVKIDDLGLYLAQNYAVGILHHMGRFLLWLAPILLKALSFIGLIAMFLVGGGIIIHGIDPLHHFVELLDLGAVIKGFISMGLALLFGGLIIICLKLGRLIWR